MDDRKLKEYAEKIYLGDIDYSLQKAFNLFPKYYTKILFYYNELVLKATKKLSEDTFRVVGTKDAILLHKSSQQLFQKIEAYGALVKSKLSSLEEFVQTIGDTDRAHPYYEKFRIDVFNLEQNILEDIRSNSKLIQDQLKKIISISTQYGFSNILKEATFLTLKTDDINKSIAVAFQQSDKIIDNLL